MTDEIKPEPTEEERQAEAKRVAEESRTPKEETKEAPVAPLPTEHKKPDGVPEKFWNAETGEVDYASWGKAHNELESKFTQSRQEPNDDPKKAAEEKPAAEPKDQQTAVSAASAEYAEHGKLSDATYESLAKHGLSKDMVDTYISAQTTKANELNKAAYDVTEGAENYSAMIKWAGEALNDEEIAEYDAMVTSGNPALIEKATKGLYARFQDEAPTEGRRVGGGNGAHGAGVFQSKAEYLAAMRAPAEGQPGKTRYEVDAAYRNEVIAKMQRSRKANIDIFN